MEHHKYLTEEQQVRLLLLKSKIENKEVLSKDETIEYQRLVLTILHKQIFLSVM